MIVPIEQLPSTFNSLYPCSLRLPACIELCYRYPFICGGIAGFEFAAHSASPRITLIYQPDTLYHSSDQPVPSTQDVVSHFRNSSTSTKFQLEESKKPNPRYVLELQTTGKCRDNNTQLCLTYSTRTSPASCATCYSSCQLDPFHLPPPLSSLHCNSHPCQPLPKSTCSLATALPAPMITAITIPCARQATHRRHCSPLPKVPTAKRSRCGGKQSSSVFAVRGLQQVRTVYFLQQDGLD